MLIARRTHLVSASDCFVEELTCIEDLERIQSDWDNLARQCAEQNIFYESLMLLPALRYLL
ncbi:MAG: hypothetical protein KDD62_08930, partial [Bdellovibrionales bacterium]|nr:hypothetical protein [Bdellovibrionales bacterium]